MKSELNSFFIFLTLCSGAHAADQYTSNPGTWNTTNLNWSAAATPGGPYTSAWANTTADIAVFEGTAGTVTVGQNLNADGLTFNVTGYNLSAASAVTLTGAGGMTYSLAPNVTATIGANVTLQSSGTSQTWTLSGANKNTSVLDLNGTITAATNNTETIRDITVNVNSGGRLNGASSIVVGSGTNGSGSNLNISGGTLAIGSANTSASLILNNSGGITADTTVTLSSGGAITFAANSTVNGLRFGPTGTISAAGTNLTGTFNLDGGTLTTNKIFMGSITYTGGATYNATFNFNGGTLKALATNNTDFMGPLRGTGYIVKSLGAKIDSNGKDITIAQPLLDGTGGGGLTKEGLGTLTLSGANTYTGDTIINGGKLAITAPYSAITATTINNGGRLKINSNGTTPSSLGTVSVNTGGGFEFNLGSVNAANQPAVNVGTLNANANYAVDLAVGTVVPGAYTVTLLNYTAKTGSGTPTIGTLPPGVILTSGPTDTGSSIQIGFSVANQLVWSKGDGDWDTTSSNWNSNAAIYAEPAVVSFPDLAEAGNGINELNVAGTVSPLDVTINNTGDFDTNAYSFSGSGAISGATGITKTGAGIVTFSNANSYSGNLAINGGAVVKTVADTTSGNITVADTATFALSGSIADGSGQTLTVAGPGAATGILASGTILSRGSLQSVSGNNTWDGNLILAGTAGTGGNTRIGVQNGASLTLNGNISESVVGMSPLFRAGLTLADSITINGIGSWTGTTRLFSEGGAIKLGGHDRFPTTAPLSAGSTASAGVSVFDVAGYNQTAAGLTGDGTGRIQNSGGSSVLTSNPAAACTFAGIMQDNISFVIGGTAVQSLSGDNTYSGNTTIASGASLTVTGTGELKFYPATNGITNSVDGSGTLLVNGILRIELADADPTAGNFWTLVDVANLTETFGTTFKPSAVTGGDFTETALGSGIWELADSGKIWTFTESDGKLTVANAVAGYSAWSAANAPGQTVDQDHDFDGVKNGVEYFMGLSGNAFTATPTLDSAKQISWTMGDAYTGVYGIDYLVQTSVDLNVWTPVLEADVTIDTTIPGKSVSYTLGGTGPRFVRLVVNEN